jgi:hypothetical protein
MGIEDNIRNLLSQGNTPQSVISQGYKKSTVYKVYNEFTAQVVPVTEPIWNISYQLPKNRFMPGETVALNYSIRNNSLHDLYVYRSGLKPEWLEQEQWYAQENRFLLRPRESRNLVINITIPNNTFLGEYEMRWGVDAQFLGPEAPLPSIMQTQWATPFFLEVKKPLTGYKVFISHSTEDIYLVRQMACSLDYEGIEGLIAEDYSQPGIVLEEKFKTMIRESHFFLALMTSTSLSSKWVILETNYALSINKPCILLKEKEAVTTSDIEWVEFSRFDPPEIIISKAQQALDQVKQKHYGLTLPPNLAPVALGVIAFLFGLAAGKSKE